MTPAPPQPAPARPDWTRGASGVIAAIALAAVASLACVRSWDRAAVGEPHSPAIIPPHAAKLDINAATAAELELLPRIGPALAGRIAADRAARGPFRSADDLDRVPGIGPRTVDRLRPYVLVGAPPPAGR